MQATWHVLLPPLVTIIAAFFSRKIIPSIIIGVCIAALIATDFSITPALMLIAQRTFEKLTDLDTLYTFIFLFIISSTIVLASYTGSPSAFAHFVTKKIRQAHGVEISSILLSFLLSIDDYLSSLTVGYVMRPLTDRFSIPRAKLAFLIHSLAGPVVILNPFSSWVAMLVGQLDEACISPTGEVCVFVQPFTLFLYTLPFIFYSLLIVVSVGFLVARKISFGPMYEHERIAQEEKNLFGGKKPLEERIPNVKDKNGVIYDLILPLGSIVLGTTTGIILGYNAPTSMLIAGLFGFTGGCLRALSARHITPKQMPVIIYNGITLMLPAVATVTAASILGALMSTDLLAGYYFAKMLSTSLGIVFLPLTFFITATIITFATGSSWGTIALIVPISVPMVIKFLNMTPPVAISAAPILLPSLGAILSGAVVGDHLSPISETTVMASTGAGAYVLDHVKTQLPYAAPALVCTALAYLLTGVFVAYAPHINFALSFGISLLVCLALLHMLNQRKS